MEDDEITRNICWARELTEVFNNGNIYLILTPVRDRIHVQAFSSKSFAGEILVHGKTGYQKMISKKVDGRYYLSNQRPSDTRFVYDNARHFIHSIERNNIHGKFDGEILKALSS